MEKLFFEHTFKTCVYEINFITVSSHNSKLFAQLMVNNQYIAYKDHMINLKPSIVEDGSSELKTLLTLL